MKEGKITTWLFLGVFAMVAVIVLGAVFWQEKSKTTVENAGFTFSQAVGKEAQDFALQSYDEKTYKLSELRGKNILLFFNEGVMCYPSCWNQVMELGKDKRFEENNTLAFSVVVDTKEKWAQAVEKMPELSEAKVLLDTDTSVSRKYGILTLPSSMHPGSMPGHTYILIDKEGIIRYTLDDPQMGIHNEKLIEEIKKLS